LTINLIFLGQYNINLVFENFTLLALSEEDLPFVMLNLHILQIAVDQNEKNEMLGSIKAFEVNGSYFNPLRTENINID